MKPQLRRFRVRSREKFFRKIFDAICVVGEHRSKMNNDKHDVELVRLAHLVPLYESTSEGFLKVLHQDGPSKSGKKSKLTCRLKSIDVAIIIFKIYIYIFGTNTRNRAWPRTYSKLWSA